MKTIFKYQLPAPKKNDPRVRVQMPPGEVLHVDTINHEIFLWALVDRQAKKVERVFEIHPTGFTDLEEDRLTHVGTVLMNTQDGFGLGFGSLLVWHIFERV